MTNIIFDFSFISAMDILSPIWINKDDPNIINDFFKNVYGYPVLTFIKIHLFFVRYISILVVLSFLFCFPLIKLLLILLLIAIL